jgi:HD superfamily phosphohydrolase
MNKRKIINDPVYGFIPIPFDVVYDVMEHRFFQRLRRIQQLGFSSLVYPGATHTRFHHSIGAMHLMTRALDVLKKKGIAISVEEEQATILAILLHDLGHGPYSHALEGTLVNAHHENISKLLMQALEKEFGNIFSLSISIFEGNYENKFLHQLVSGQLDMDRMDYLNRDSFYTGVSEGVIGYDRIINMLDVVEDKIVVEEKGIYSIEKFLVARRLMYWQVYLHKTVLCAEILLKNIFKYIKQKKIKLPFDCTLNLFIENDFNEINSAIWLQAFCELDDTDIVFALKYFAKSEDKILSKLSSALIYRKLFHIEFNTLQEIESKLIELKNRYSNEEMQYLVTVGSTSNNMYNTAKNNIYIKFKDNKLVDIASITEQWNIDTLSNPVVKHYIIYPK